MHLDPTSTGVHLHDLGKRLTGVHVHDRGAGCVLMAVEHHDLLDRCRHPDLAPHAQCMLCRVHLVAKTEKPP